MENEQNIQREVRKKKKQKEKYEDNRNYISAHLP